MMHDVNVFPFQGGVQLFDFGMSKRDNARGPILSQGCHRGQTELKQAAVEPFHQRVGMLRDGVDADLLQLAQRSVQGIERWKVRHSHREACSASFGLGALETVRIERVHEMKPSARHRR